MKYNRTIRALLAGTLLLGAEIASASVVYQAPTQWVEPGSITLSDSYAINNTTQDKSLFGANVETYNFVDAFGESWCPVGCNHVVASWVASADITFLTRDDGYRYFAVGSSSFFETLTVTNTTDNGNTVISWIFDTSVDHDQISSTFTSFDIYSDGLVISNTGNFSVDSMLVAAPAAVVPVPAAAWLFGSGLIGLVGVARRKKA